MCVDFQRAEIPARHSVGYAKYLHQEQHQSEVSVNIPQSLWYISLTAQSLNHPFSLMGRKTPQTKSTFSFLTPPKQRLQNLRDGAALISSMAGNMLKQTAWKTWNTYSLSIRDGNKEGHEQPLDRFKHGASCFVFTAHLNVITSSQINCPTIRPFLLLTSRDWRQ